MCALRVHTECISNILMSLPCHKQKCLTRLYLDKCFSHHWATCMMMSSTFIENAFKNNMCYLATLFNNVNFEAYFRALSSIKTVALKDNSHANWKSTDKWSLTCFKYILKFLRSNYLKFCSNLPVKFAIFLKSSLRFSFYKQNFTAQ